MSKSVREMTREELIAECAKLERECLALSHKCREKECQIKEIQSHIDCLKAELAEIQMNKLELPEEPIEVATMLIKATVTCKCKSNPFQKAFNANCPDEYETDRYSDEDLKQIAEHLLVYCKQAEVE